LKRCRLRQTYSGQGSVKPSRRFTIHKSRSRTAAQARFLSSRTAILSRNIPRIFG